VSSTLLTLVVIPAVYGLVKGWRLSARSKVPLVTIEAEPTTLKEAAE
jgi:copper/silver efflux system protein